jgi:hypothetical protein
MPQQFLLDFDVGTHSTRQARVGMPKVCQPILPTPARDVFQAGSLTISFDSLTDLLFAIVNHSNIVSQENQPAEH